MQFIQNTLLKTGGLVVSGLVSQWMRTLDSKALYYDPQVDPAFPENHERKRIYVFWHEYILFYLYHRKNCRISMLLSRHRDADCLQEVAKIFGFGTVRGSTKRGGAAALREMMEHAESHHLTITPDGPRGPRRRLAPGSIFLASKLQLPIVAIGIGYQTPWRVPTWDRFAIPRPFTRARAIISPEIMIPSRLTQDELEKQCRTIENLINRLCNMAQEWADSGVTYAEQVDMIAGPCNLLGYYPKSQHESIKIREI